MLQVIQSVGLNQQWQFQFSSEEQLAQLVNTPRQFLPNLNEKWELTQIHAQRCPKSGTLNGSVVFSMKGIVLEHDSEMIDLLEDIN